MTESGWTLGLSRIRAILARWSPHPGDLRDEQWQLVQPFIPTYSRGLLPGRPNRDPREVLNGVLWTMRSGDFWTELPDHYPPYRTCFYWFRKWVEGGVLNGILKILADDLRSRGGIDLSECFFADNASGVQNTRPTIDLRRLNCSPKSWQYQTARIFTSSLVLTESIARREHWLKGSLISVASALSEVDSYGMVYTKG